MTLEEFFVSESLELAEFAKWWRRQSLTAPDQYPDSLTIGEWSEMLALYKENL